MVELSDYLDAEGLEAMSFRERDRRLKELLDPESYELYEKLLHATGNYPHYDNCQLLYDFIADHNIDTLLESPNRPETEALVPFIIEHGVKGKKKILDIGCGSGLKTVYYAFANPEADIIAIDFSSPLLKLAEKRAEKYGVVIDFIKADLVELENPEKYPEQLKGQQFDSIICTNMINEGGVLLVAGGLSQYLEMLPEKVKALAALTAPDGQLILSCNPYDLEEYKDILYSRLSEVGFKNIDYKLIKYPCYTGEEIEEDTNLTLICKKK